MNRTIANVIIDLAAALLFVGMIATGYILRFPLPPGSNRVLSLWGLTRHQWGGIHYENTKCHCSAPGSMPELIGRMCRNNK